MIATGSNPRIVLRAAEVRVGEKRILGPIDLAVERGAHVLVVGPSGSGKTTLLRAIAGLQALAAGCVELAGVLATDRGRILLPPHERRIGFLFQGGALWPHMTAIETVAFVLRCRGVPRGERARRATELLETVELAGFEDRLPGTLSGGEGQRLALARALASDPEVLLLDEPLGPLDVELREALIERLDALQKTAHWTTLHVTHDEREVRRLADRVLRLERGAVVPAREVTA